MADLLHLKAKRCYTASGCLIHDGKVLLVKHKKLQKWLNPGGHTDPNELPHETAEREFWEETGVKVKAYDLGSCPMAEDPKYQKLPQPFNSNLHWMNENNYLERMKKGKSLEAANCELHLHFGYLVKPVSGVEFKKNVEETDGIAWFSEVEIDSIDTWENLKNELRYAFSLIKQYAKK